MPGFMPARSARKSLISGARMATISSASARQDQRRHQADHVVGGHADQQAGLGGALRRARRRGGRARCRASGPGRAPRSRRRRPPSSRSQRRPSGARRRVGGVLQQAVLFHDADASRRRRAWPAGCRRRWCRGCPGWKMSAALRARHHRADRHARAQALGQRHHVRAGCRPTGARTTCRCGPCRTAPRRSSAASRARRTAGAPAAGSRRASG